MKKDGENRHSLDMEKDFCGSKTPKGRACTLKSDEMEPGVVWMVMSTLESDPRRCAV